MDRISAGAARALADPALAPVRWDARDRARARRRSEAFVRDAMARYGVRDENRVKPGIGESTRALLRRVPERLVVRDARGADVRHLLHLAGESGVPVEVRRDLPFRATVIIRTLGE